MTTGLRFTFEVNGQDSDAFELTGFEGSETLSVPFEYTITLSSEADDLSPDDMVDKPAVLTVLYDDEPMQHLHGIVSSFRAEKCGFHYSRYVLTLVPEIKRLSLRQNSRIFQQVTIQAVIETLLGEMGIVNFTFSLNRTLPKREYCVQYRESDLAFVQRLAAEEGLFFYHEYEAEKSTLVFTDDIQALPDHPEPLLLNENPGGSTDIQYLAEFSFEKRFTSSSVQMKDYTFKNPPYSLLHEHFCEDIAHQQDTYEYYQAPGRYKDEESGSAFTQFRMEYLAREAHLGRAKGNVKGLHCGLKFDMTGHTNSGYDRDWTIVTLTQRGTQAVSKGAEAMSNPTTYENELGFIPGDRPWRAKPQERPVIDGPQVATVVGPSGEEIYCDEYGRVKVQFPWDRYAQGDEHCSCWVRVSQAWAGASYGFVAIPRIGHEVIVSFLEGDPDQPIITGRTYHAVNHAAYELPKNKTRTLIKTDSHKAEGSNEIRFEDESGAEEIYIHAQKDQNNVVENNETTEVKVDRTENVGNNETITIGNDRTETVVKNEKIDIGMDRTETVGANENISITANRTESVGANEKISIAVNRTETVGANEKINIGANQSVTIGANKTETVTIASAETVGAAKALTVGGAYQVSVGAAKNESVAASSSEQVGVQKHMVVGKRFELSVGASSLVLNADGTIILTGKEIKIEGAKHVEVNSKLVDVN